MIIYRVQDKDGRGPFKPGFTKLWLQVEKELTSWIEEFGKQIINDVKPDEYIGSGVDKIEKINLWFTNQELIFLKLLGYNLVLMKVNRILAKSDIQLVFTRNRPLNKK